MVLILTVILYPISTNVIRSFQLEAGGYGLDNYVYFFTDPMQVDNILYTMVIVVLTVLITGFLGYLLAIYLRFSKTQIARWMNSLYILPRFIPGLVAVNGVITVIRDSGLINRIFASIGLEVTLGFMYDWKGILLMNVWFNVPFVAMLMGSALSRIKDSMIEAARDVGAGAWTLFRSMIWPLSYRDLLISSAFVFMVNVGSFTTPYLMGGNYPKMLGIKLFELFNTGEYERAAALSVIIFLFSSLSAAIYIITNLHKPDWKKV